jgi:hypothetical protein
MPDRRRFRLGFESLERRDTPGGLGGGPTPGDPPPVDNVHFHKINARGEGQITSFNTVTGQATTQGTIDNGLLRGTTSFAAQFIDAKGDYVGTTTIVTDHGTLTLADVGVLNADGSFTDHATVTGGTGRFAGATGELVFQGHELADGVHFLDDSITGEVGIDQ